MFTKSIKNYLYWTDNRILLYPSLDYFGLSRLPMWKNCVLQKTAVFNTAYLFCDEGHFAVSLRWHICFKNVSGSAQKDGSLYVVVRRIYTSLFQPRADLFLGKLRDGLCALFIVRQVHFYYLQQHGLWHKKTLVLVLKLSAFCDIKYLVFSAK